jgi:hypothetical protein
MVPDYMTHSMGKAICVLPRPRGWDAPYTICAVVRPHRADNQTLRLLVERIREAISATVDT